MCMYYVIADRSCAVKSLPGIMMAYNNNGMSLGESADFMFATAACSVRSIGSNTQLWAEAGDAGKDHHLKKDGKSGDVEFPFAQVKPLFTIGEYGAKSGYMVTGPPDGQGVMLLDESTIRLIFQSESYGHMYGTPTWYFSVNDGVNFTGSHVHFVDYDRKGAASFFDDPKSSAADFAIDAGTMIKTVYNLAGNLVGKPEDMSPNPHFGDTAADGTIVSAVAKGEDGSYVWSFHSFCSAHLEEAEQWGKGFGVVDSMFITNEEWTDFFDEAKVAQAGYVGLSAQVIDLATKTMYAAGAFGQGGYEKIVEMSCGVAGSYVCFAMSGYNGEFGNGAMPLLERKKAVSPKRSDGTDWVWTENVVPSRMYIGLKGYDAKGKKCGAKCSFLAKNGLEYGQVYGFAVPVEVEDRDAFHRETLVDSKCPAAGCVKTRAAVGSLDGYFAPIDWRWNGEVKSFEYDAAWHFQEPPLNLEGYKFWNPAGRDKAGAKTEHLSPDPRGNPRYVHGSTAGYIGFYDMMAGNAMDPRSLGQVLSATGSGKFPEVIPATYELFEGETYVAERIHLGGKFMTAAEDIYNNVMCDNVKMPTQCKTTFEDVDGIEWIADSAGDYLIFSEDGYNVYGDRLLLVQVPTDRKELPHYYMIAQAGGELNTRALAKVGIPKGTWTKPAGNEFSGSSDWSGILLPGTPLGGAARRAADLTVPINEKFISVGHQAHGMQSGVVKYFGLDRGGQMYAVRPNIGKATELPANE